MYQTNLKGGLTQSKDIEHIKESFERIQKDLKDREEQTQKQYEKFDKNMRTALRCLVGTQSRGAAGENILQNILKPFIHSGLVSKNVKLESMKVEFAVKFDDGRYLPIDSKFPDLGDLFGKIEETENIGEQKRIKREIKKVLTSKKKEAEKYINVGNTTGNVLVAVPEAALDIVPEAVSEGNQQVVLCGYTQVPTYIMMLKAQYQLAEDQRDVTELQKTIQDAVNLFCEVENKASTIKRATRQIDKASDSISKCATKGSSLK